MSRAIGRAFHFEIQHHHFQLRHHNQHSGQPPFGSRETSLANYQCLIVIGTMQNVRSFVEGRNRSGSPQLDRRAIGANSKVPAPPTRLEYPNGQQQQTHAQSSRPMNYQQERPQVPGQEPKRNAWDTDVESADTTHDSQNLYPEGNQQGVNQEDRFPTSDYGDDVDYEPEIQGDQDGYDQEGFNQETVDQNLAGLPLGTQQEIRRRMGIEQAPDRFGGDESYPPTTSGPGSSFHHGQNERVVITSDPSDDMSSSPLQNRKGEEQTQRQSSPSPHARPTTAPIPVRQMKSQKILFQKGAAHREKTRPDPNFAVHSGRGSAPPIASGLNFQPPRYSQVENQGNRMHHPQPQHNVAFAEPVVEQQLNPFSQQGHSGPSIIPQPIPIPQFETPAEPLEDYNDTTLFRMNFSQLKNEDFDFNPNAPSSVLTDSLRRKPLPDRLEHVRKNLSPEDQLKFFTSLPAAEWDESGDWFIEQLTKVMGKMKEARQTKRQKTKEFEDEIEKRHEEVAKQQSLVEKALGNMRNQGQHLLPRTPRRSPGHFE